jgi:hypothetical protein
MKERAKVRCKIKKGYQPMTNKVKDERGDIFADPHKSVSGRIASVSY